VESKSQIRLYNGSWLSPVRGLRRCDARPLSGRRRPLTAWKPHGRGQRTRRILCVPDHPPV